MSLDHRFKTLVDVREYRKARGAMDDALQTQAGQ